VDTCTTKPLHATATFLREYSRASGKLAAMAEQEVHYMLRRVASEPATWVTRYDKVENLPPRVLELEVGGGPRLLVHVNGAITLCRFGGHDIVKKTTRGGDLLRQVDNAEPAPRHFLPRHASRLYPQSSGDRADAWGHELVEDWAYWLDDEQEALACLLVTDLEERLIGGTKGQHLILGGPGTGKTTVLISLLQRLCSAAPDSKETWDVRLVASERMVDYVRRSTNWKLDPVLRPPTEGQPDIILVDDPLWVDDDLGYSQATSTVVAVDPLQVASPLSDAQVDSLSTTWNLHWLSSCYRQKEEVGLAAKVFIDTVARSSPFLRDDKQAAYAKERKRVTELCNQMSYPNPTGRVRTFEEPTDGDWLEHLEWLRAQGQRGALWNHWPGVLLVVDEGVRIPTGWTKMLKAVQFDRIRLADVEKIKGLEYQHVIVLLGRQTFRSLSAGFSGSGQAKYRDFVRMRIPFTRAKDSIATFVL
jgi:hypothetical protein